VRILRDPKLTPIAFDAVYGMRPCVLRMDDSGTYAAALQLDLRVRHGLFHLQLLDSPSYAPRETPFRSGQIRMYNTFTMDASLNKTFALTERFRLQLRGEALTF